MKFGYSPEQMWAAMLGLGICTQIEAADHGHLNAGALSPQQNAPLIWANGGNFIATAGYVKTLDFTNAGTYKSYFQQNITLTALPATAAHAGPDPQAPALGSVIRAKMSCLQAPAGGRFGFWDSNAITPTISMAAGETASNIWLLSQNDGSPGTDPYGHIHGRRFSASKPGLYKVTFQAIDVSTNGLNGGPIHKPSAELPVWFQAGVQLLPPEPDYAEGHVHVRFGGRLGYTFQVESSPTLGPAAHWLPVGNPVIGDDMFFEVIQPGDPGLSRYYRLNYILTPL